VQSFAKSNSKSFLTDAVGHVIAPGSNASGRSDFAYNRGNNFGRQDMILGFKDGHNKFLKLEMSLTRPSDCHVSGIDKKAR
jgi:hypothetical protein